MNIIGKITGFVGVLGELTANILEICFHLPISHLGI